MNSRLFVIVVAAGAVLLSACGPDNSAAATGTDTAAGVAPDSVQKMVQAVRGDGKSFGGPADVNCGPVDPANANPVLMAMDTPAGIVGCEEAFNVFAEYDEAAKNGEVQVAELDSGWTCVMVDSPFAAEQVMSFCFVGTVSSLVAEGGVKERAMYTAPAEVVPPGDMPTENPAALPSPPVAEHLNTPKDVDCGPVPEMANGDRVMAMDNEWGIPGCEDALNVLGEVYEAATNGATSNGPFQVPSGWVCDTIEHPDFPDAGKHILYCASGYVAQDQNFRHSLVIYTKPA